MKSFYVLAILVVCFCVVAHGQESEEEDKGKEEGWWSRFKQKVKSVVARLKEDLKSLWGEVVAKARDMQSWSSSMFDSFKDKLKEFLDKEPDLPDDEKNEIENFISKLKTPSEKPIEKRKEIDP